VDKKVQSGTTVQLQGKTSGILKSLLWTPSQGLSDPASLNPSIKIIQTTEFTITATSVDNCTASDNVLIQVLEEIIPPNIFSPNGDGINDKWYIKNIDSYDNIEVKIFNRYGVLLLDKKGYNSSTAWDGTHNGKNLPVGTYFYVIKMTENKLINGAVSIIR
jgi:gliding motility-associated-like protein